MDTDMYNQQSAGGFAPVNLGFGPAISNNPNPTQPYGANSTDDDDTNSIENQRVFGAQRAAQVAAQRANEERMVAQQRAQMAQSQMPIYPNQNASPRALAAIADAEQRQAEQQALFEARMAAAQDQDMQRAQFDVSRSMVVDSQTNSTDNQMFGTQRATQVAAQRANEERMVAQQRAQMAQSQMPVYPNQNASPRALAAIADAEQRQAEQRAAFDARIAMIESQREARRAAHDERMTARDEKQAEIRDAFDARLTARGDIPEDKKEAFDARMDSFDTRLDEKRDAFDERMTARDEKQAEIRDAFDARLTAREDIPEGKKEAFDARTASFEERQDDKRAAFDERMDSADDRQTKKRTAFDLRTGNTQTAGSEDTSFPGSHSNAHTPSVASSMGVGNMFSNGSNRRMHSAGNPLHEEI